MAPRSNFQVDLDELRVAHGSLGEVADINRRVGAALPRGGSPVARGAADGAAVPASGRAMAGYSALLGRLGERQQRGIDAIEETRRRLADIEAAYRAADRFG